MTIEICLESYGALAGSIDAGMMRSFLDVRPMVRRRTPAAGQGDARVCFDGEVFSAADKLPFKQAETLWLVDVCGCSYDAVAESTRTSREVVGRRIASARKTIRHDLERDDV